MSDYRCGIDWGYSPEDAATPVAVAIKHFWIENADLVPGTIASSFGLADYLMARGLGPGGFRMSNPERLLSTWRHARRWQEEEARRPKIGYVKDGVFVEIDVKTLSPEAQRLVEETFADRRLPYSISGSVRAMRDLLAEKGLR